MFVLRWRDWGDFAKRHEATRAEFGDFTKDVEQANKYVSSHEAIAAVIADPVRAAYGGGMELVEIEIGERVL